MKIFSSIIVNASLLLIFCSPTLAASKAELQKELKELGNMLGYSLGCTTERMGKDFAAPEQKKFIQRVFPKYKVLGPSAETTFNYAIREGLLAVGASGGKQCDQAISMLISKYEAAGLTGNAYRPALRQSVPVQEKKTSPTTQNQSSNPMCPDKILDINTVKGKYLGWFEAEEGTDTIGITLPTGQDIYITASEEDAAKFFGKGTGQQVSVTYRIEQFWLDETQECLRLEVLSGGQILSPSTPQGSEEFIGYIDEYNETGMAFWRLVDNQKREIIHLGSPFEFDESMTKCLQSAIDSEYPVKIIGKIETLKDGSQSLIKDNTISCQRYTGD